jgi:hypothetical protein
MRRAVAISKSKVHGPGLDPWALVWGQPFIDADRLAAAIEDDLDRNPKPDFRTRLLIRDSMRALKGFWGERAFSRWLNRADAGQRIRAILHQDLGKTGYHAIRRRLVSNVGKDELQQIFEILGERVRGPVEVNIAGSAPTLVKELTARPTDDIDVVDEVPAEIRNQRAVLDKIKAKYGLTLGHVQSHYLPAHWADRRHYLGDFGGLRVYLVDEYDVFVSKLSSSQEKHKDDLRVMARALDRQRIRELLFTDGKLFLASAHDRPKIEANWHFLFREPLFPETATGGKAPKKPPGRAKKKPRKRGG